MTKIIRNFISLLIILGVCNASAEERFSIIRSLDEKINFRPREDPFQIFILSSEMNLAGARQILSKAPKGLFITIGADRGFNSAALSPHNDYLLMIDYSADILNYNRINIELLKAKNLTEYRKLRWTKNFDNWLSFKNNHKQLDVKLTKDDFAWWQDNVINHNTVYNSLAKNFNRHGKDLYYEKFIKIYSSLAKYGRDNNISREALLYPNNYQDWQNLHLNLTQEDWHWWQSNVLTKVNPWRSSARDMIADPDNHKYAVNLVSLLDKSGNYMWNKELYKRLHKLAIHNKIALCQMNLANPDHTKKLVSAIEQSLIKINVIDFSNAWDYVYIYPTSKYHDMVNQLIPYGQDNSILLAMNNYMKVPHFQYHLYMGFTFDNVKQWPSNFRLMHFMSQSLDFLPLFSGRLFNKDNMPIWQRLDF